MSIFTKFCVWELAKVRVETARRAGKKIAFTNGCFDILHAGHVHCLTEARQHGDILVVGLNSDDSVRFNKGNARPIIKQEHRAQLLAALECVDILVFFDEVSPEKLIRYLEPDVIVKGGDYNPLTLAGSEFVRNRGGKVVIVPLLEGFSTTEIIKRVGNLC